MNQTTAMETRTVCCSTGTLIGAGMMRHAANNAPAISVKLTCNQLLNPCRQRTSVGVNPLCYLTFFVFFSIIIRAVISFSQQY